MRVALLLLRRRWRNAAPLPDRYRPSRRQAAARCFAATPLLLFAVNRVDDARAALGRFNSVDRARHLARSGDRLRPRRLELLLLSRSTASRSTPRRHPYALDVPGNGVDEDGYRRRLRLCRRRGRARRAGHRRAASATSILIVLESTRADAIGRARRRPAGRPRRSTRWRRSGSAAPRRLQPCRLHHPVAAEPVHRRARAGRRPPVAGPRFPRQRLSGRRLFRPGRGFRRHREPRRHAPRLDLRRRQHAARRARVQLRRARLGQYRRQDAAARVRPAARPAAKPGRGRISSTSTCNRRISPIPGRGWTGSCPASRSRAARSAPPTATGWRAPIGTRSPITTG